MKYKSVAVWPKGTVAFLNDVTEDEHGTKEQAEGVCKLLREKGFGGDGKIFPLEARIEEIKPPNPETTGAKSEIDKAIQRICSYLNESRTLHPLDIQFLLTTAKRVSEVEKERDVLRRLLRPIQDCPQCHGVGEFPDSEEGGIPTTCDCWNATKKLLQSKLTTAERERDELVEILNRSEVPIGNELREYTIVDRVQILGTHKAFWADKVKKLEKQLSTQAADMKLAYCNLHKLQEGGHVGTPINKGCAAMLLINEALSTSTARKCLQPE